uniref:Uncharacterized protein n=1 Tax=Caenorhabditis japonica TaxID=281687 RepID=A0A8R1I6V4_CAEJA
MFISNFRISFQPPADRFKELRSANKAEFKANMGLLAQKAEQSDVDSEAMSLKFKKMGHVEIATNIDEAFKQECKEAENVVLQNVVYDETGNEMFEIGDDVDKYEVRIV